MTRRRYDLIIVGGGPAGISTALHLQRHHPALAGSMVVLEKERYPRDKFCAGALAARALQQLEEIDVHLDVPAVKLNGLSLAFAGGTVQAREPNVGVVIRRMEFDHALARAAMDRGVEVRQGVTVTGVETSQDGVSATLKGGEVLEARALVGADGVGGATRRTAGFAKPYFRAQVIELDTERIEGDPPGDVINFDFSMTDLEGYAWNFPTLVDGEPLMCRGVYLLLGRGGGSARQRLERYLAARGLDIGRYRVKPFAEQGFEPHTAISRSRVLLVGEAAGIDICTGEGIPQAIAYGELAGRYLAHAFRAGAFHFRDWYEKVGEARFGRRLMLRHRGFRAFYGPDRKILEQMTLEAPSLIQAGLQDFAGRPMSPATVLRGLAQSVPSALRGGVGPMMRVARIVLGSAFEDWGGGSLNGAEAWKRGSEPG